MQFEQLRNHLTQSYSGVETVHRNLANTSKRSEAGGMSWQGRSFCGGERGINLAQEVVKGTTLAFSCVTVEAVV